MLNKKNEYINYCEHRELLKRFSGCENKYITYYLHREISNIDPDNYSSLPYISKGIVKNNLDYEASLYIYWLESLKLPKNRFIFGDSLLGFDDMSIHSSLGCIRCGGYTYYLQSLTHGGEEYLCRCCTYSYCHRCVPISPVPRDVDDAEKCFKKTKKYVERANSEISKCNYGTEPHYSRNNWLQLGLAKDIVDEVTKNAK